MTTQKQHQNVVTQQLWTDRHPTGVVNLVYGSHLPTPHNNLVIIKMASQYLKKQQEKVVSTSHSFEKGITPEKIS